MAEEQQDRTPSGHPIVDGRQQLTPVWSLVLPFRMARRIEDDSLVFWAAGGILTIWLNVWGCHSDEAEFDRAVRWRDLLAKVSAAARDRKADQIDPLWRYSYRLAEDASDGRISAFYGFVLGSDEHLQFAAYFDEEATAATASEIFRSVAAA